MSRHSKRLQVTTNADTCRIPIFSYTRRSQRVTEQQVSTSWGTATITGRLDQRHRDVIDIVAVAAEGWRPEGSHGDMVARVDSSRLRKLLGWDRWTYRQILDILRDLRAGEIAGRGEWTGILTRIAESSTTPRPRLPSRQIRGRKGKKLLRGPSHTPDPTRTEDDLRGGVVWEITLSGAWIRLNQQLPVKYPLQVIRMQHGISQAVTRFMLSHAPGARYGIDTLFNAVGVPTKRYKRAIDEMSADMEIMAECGVRYDPIRDMVYGPSNPDKSPEVPRIGPPNPGDGPSNPGDRPSNPDKNRTAPVSIDL